MLQTITYTGRKLVPLYATPPGATSVIKLAEGKSSAGQLLEETATAGTFRALRTAVSVRGALQYDIAVDSDGKHFMGQQASNEIGVGDQYTDMYTHGDFDTRDLLALLPSASLTTALTGANNDLIFSAVPSGAAGNAVTVMYADPGAASQALSVVVTGHAIVVNLATDGSSVITSTAAQVAAAILASAAASALVTTANAAGNSGAGVVTALAATALAGGSDTGAALTNDGTGDAIVAALGRLESGINSAGILHMT